MTGYILSPAAQASLKNIKLWSSREFGSQLMRTYLLQIREKMRALSAAPLSGQHRTDIKPGYYSALVGSHTIYYRISENAIEIIDLLHQSMEPDQHL